MDIKFDNTDKTFKPTVEWMKVRYKEMNDLLFNGELGSCDFKIFTIGNGSQGRKLGFFMMQATNLSYNKKTRKMFYTDIYFDNIPITHSNFAKICRPLIAINGNYHGTECAFLNTLVHEMCHYLDYMSGIYPRNKHGKGFKEIAENIRFKLESYGLLKIEQFASTEQKEQIELDSHIRDKQIKKKEKKMSSIQAVFQFYKTGTIELTTTSSDELVQYIIDKMNDDKYNFGITKIEIVKDMELINTLYNNGYLVNMRKWRTWDVTNEKWLGMLNNVEKETIYQHKYGLRTESIKRNSYDKIITEVIKNYTNRINKDNIDNDSNLIKIPSHEIVY